MDSFSMHHRPRPTARAQVTAKAETTSAKMQLATLTLAMLLMLALLTGGVSAQGMAQVTSGLRTNPDAPIEIEADQLDIFDKEKIAVFKGSVRAKQGDTIVNSARLTVHYSGGGVGTAQSITRLEADGGVRISQKDQNAKGDRAYVDMVREVITLSGNVVLTQGKNVLRGSKLTVNMKSGAAQMLSAAKTGNANGKGKGRVQGLFIPNQK